MKRSRKPAALTLLSLAILLFAAAFLAGCGNSGGNESGKTTLKTPQGEVTVEDQGGSITVNEGGESATMSQSTVAPTEDELGVPIYPGSTFDAEDSGRVDYSAGGSQVYAGTAVFLTGDDVLKVMDWYANKLGEPQVSSATAADWLVGELASGNYSAIHIEQEGSQTRIAITHMAASIP